MKTIQTYLQGASHKANATPCEDRTFSLSYNNVSAIALADGAGNSKYTHSATGAECVTKVICNFLCNNFDKFYDNEDIDYLKKVIVSVCQKELHKLVLELKLDSPIRLSSTLLCVAVKNNKSVICHIGDGVVGKLTSSGTQVVSAPDNGEFAGTTYFVTNANAEQHMEIIKENTADTCAYFLMSDGVSEYVYNKYDNVFYNAVEKMSLMAFLDEGQKELNDTIEKYMINHDDKSDDCSFICLTVSENPPVIKKAESKSVAAVKADKNTEDKNKQTQGSETHEECKSNKHVDIFSVDDNSRDKKSQILIRLLAICAVIIIAESTIILVLIFRNNKPGANSSSNANASWSSGTAKTSDETSEDNKTSDSDQVTSSDGDTSANSHVTSNDSDTKDNDDVPQSGSGKTTDQTVDDDATSKNTSKTEGGNTENGNAESLSTNDTSATDRTTTTEPIIKNRRSATQDRHRER